MNKKNKFPISIPIPISILIGIILLFNIVSIAIFTSKYNFLTSIEILRNFYIWILGSQPLTTIGTLAAATTAIIGYRKYSFEKNRDLYIQKLQKVYAPLYSYVVKQETGRRVFWLKSKGSEITHSFKEAPFFEIGIESSKLKLSLEQNNSTLNITSILNWEQVWKIIDKEDNYSFMSTNLINLISIRSMLDNLCYENSNNDIDEKLLKYQKEIEVKIIEDICEEYKKCILKLGLDDVKKIINLEKFSLDE